MVTLNLALAFAVLWDIDAWLIRIFAPQAIVSSCHMGNGGLLLTSWPFQDSFFYTYVRAEVK